MIASFFGRSKPINFVVVSVLLLAIFVMTSIFSIGTELAFFPLLKQLLIFLVCLFSMFVLDFFVSKNNLTKKNSYKILLFALFFAIIPETILNTNTLIANLFILFATRRLISIRSKKAIKKKLFDASFWITLAALFHFWSILFFGLIIAALIVYAIVDIKNWIVPIAGFVTVMVLLVSYKILQNDELFSMFDELLLTSFDFTTLNTTRMIVAITILFSLGLWSLFYYLKNLRSKTKSLRPSFSLIIITAIISVVIMAVSPQKDGSEFIFLFAPLAIIITNYLEVISEQWFKESILWLFIITPIVMLWL